MNNEQYLCLSCEKGFNAPRKVQEPDGLDTPPHRYSYCCPYCGDDDYVEKIETCDNCGQGIYYGHKYYRLSNTEDVFCEDCITERNA